VTGIVAEALDVGGPDARSYLQSQLSQDLDGTEERTWSLLLDPAGSLVAVLALRTAPDSVTIEFPAGLGESVLARLRRFAIRAEVEFGAPRPAGVNVATELANERSRVLAGIPGRREIERGLVAHGLDAGLLERSVSFTKGCYPGQELVARMHARGATPPYVLRRITLTAPVDVGDAVGDPTLDGVVTSAVEDAGPGRYVALCVLHRRDAALAEVDVHAAGGEVRAQIV
jgi:folate-binding protein YgfZ